MRIPCVRVRYLSMLRRLEMNKTSVGATNPAPTDRSVIPRERSEKWESPPLVIPRERSDRGNLIWYPVQA